MPVPLIYTLCASGGISVRWTPRVEDPVVRRAAGLRAVPDCRLLAPV